MPNARKKKQAKNEDFKKTKLKVGKKKATPDNFTDTSFRSKTISLPNQSIVEDKSAEITTSRNLTLTDLISQLRHYNVNVRKDAILGLQELCDSNPGLLARSLTTVVNGILKLFVDDERAVRKVLFTFIQESFSEIDPAELQPFLPLLVIYTCSAMSHIHEDIRLDAMKLMNIWIHIAPEMIVSKFWDRVVGIYMSLLSVDSNNTDMSKSSIPGSKVTTQASAKAAALTSHLHLHSIKLELLSSLCNFLETGFSRNQKDRMWFLGNFIGDPNARKAFAEKMKRYHTARDTKTTVWDRKTGASFAPTHPASETLLPYTSSLPTLNLFETSGPKSQSSTIPSGNNKEPESQSSATLGLSNCENLEHIQMLIGCFQPVLISAWLETAPSVFTASGSIGLTPALKLLHVVLRLSLVLYRAVANSDNAENISAEWLDKHCQTMVRHYVVHFPFGADSFGSRAAKTDEMLREMNTMMCELTSLHLLLARMVKQKALSHSASLAESRSDSELNSDDETDDIPPWADRIVDHVLGVLGLEEDNDQHRDKKQKTMTTMSADFREADLVSLLPAVWGFLNCLTGEKQFAIFKAIMDFFHKSHAHSGLKRASAVFIAQMYLIQSMPCYNGEFLISPGTEYAAAMETWLCSLPKMLWQLKMSHLETTRFILNIMCDIAKRSDKDVFSTKTLETAKLAMVPYFYVSLPNKGPLFGPFLDLPVDAQKRTLEFLGYIDNQSPKLQDAIQKCKERGTLDKEVESWVALTCSNV